VPESGKRGNKVNRLILILLALLAAASFAYFMREEVKPTKVTQAPQKQIVTKEVLVAAKDLAKGKVLNVYRDLVSKSISTDELPFNSVLSSKVDSVKNSMLIKPLVAGQAITYNDVIATADGSYMSSVLEPNMRAISIKVDEKTGNAGFILPGDMIDLIITHPYQENDGSNGLYRRYASKVFIENRKVLAVDQVINLESTHAKLSRTVTLQVTPKEAEMITLAEELGKISVALRANAKVQEKLANSQGTKDTEVSEFLKNNKTQPIMPPMLPSVTKQPVNKRGSYKKPASRGSMVNIIRSGATQTIEVNK